MNYWMQRIGVAVLLLFAGSALTFGAMNSLGAPLLGRGGVRRSHERKGSDVWGGRLALPRQGMATPNRRCDGMGSAASARISRSPRSSASSASETKK
mgnify:CR=1 FL=1